MTANETHESLSSLSLADGTRRLALLRVERGARVLVLLLPAFPVLTSSFELLNDMSESSSSSSMNESILSSSYAFCKNEIYVYLMPQAIFSKTSKRVKYLNTLKA